MFVTLQDVDAETLAETTTRCSVEIGELQAKNNELRHIVDSQQTLQTEVHRTVAISDESNK